MRFIRLRAHSLRRGWAPHLCSTRVCESLQTSCVRMCSGDQGSSYKDRSSGQSVVASTAASSAAGGSYSTPSSAYSVSSGYGSAGTQATSVSSAGGYGYSSAGSQSNYGQTNYGQQQQQQQQQQYQQYNTAAGTAQGYGQTSYTQQTPGYQQPQQQQQQQHASVAYPQNYMQVMTITTLSTAATFSNCTWEGSHLHLGLFPQFFFKQTSKLCLQVNLCPE